MVLNIWNHGKIRLKERGQWPSRLPKRGSPGKEKRQIALDLSARWYAATSSKFLVHARHPPSGYVDEVRPNDGTDTRGYTL
jgi:hypothetical protein